MKLNDLKTKIQINNIIFKINKKKFINKKSRGDISYSNKKIRQQKGTGMSRVCTKKSPIFIGGGKTFNTYYIKKYIKINKKMLYKAKTLKH